MSIAQWKQKHLCIIDPVFSTDSQQPLSRKLATPAKGSKNRRERNWLLYPSLTPLCQCRDAGCQRSDTRLTQGESDWLHLSHRRRSSVSGYTVCPCDEGGVWPFCWTHWSCYISEGINIFSLIQEEICVNSDICGFCLQERCGKKWSPLSPLEKSMIRDLQTTTCGDKLKDLVLFLPGVRRVWDRWRRK